MENNINFQNFTIDEFKLFVKSINAYGDISVSVSEGNNVNKEGTYTKKIDLKKLKDLSMSLGDGKEISVITGSENIYADVVVYDNNYDKGYKEYTISLFSKDDKKGLKSIVNAIIEKFKNGGGVEEEEEMDLNKLSDVQEELGKLYKWKNQYGSKGADGKIKQLEERIEYLKTNNIYKNGGGILDIHSKVLDYLAKNKFSISTFGRHNNNNIKVEDKNFGIEDQIKIEKIHPKIIVSGSSNSNTWYIFMPNEFADGGRIDINELNMPVIRTQFEDEEYEFKDGGNVDSDIAKYKKQLIAKAKSKGLYENFGQKEIRVLEDKYGYNEKIKDFDNWASNFDLGQMAEGGTTKGFCYTIGGL